MISFIKSVDLRPARLSTLKILILKYLFKVKLAPKNAEAKVYMLKDVVG